MHSSVGAGQSPRDIRGLAVTLTQRRVCPQHTITAIMGKSFSRPLFLPSPRKPDERSPQRLNLPDSKASVILPPEVLDKILEHIYTDGWRSPTLVACALVATWWTGPSQRRLFSSVKIHHGNYRQWMDGVVLSGSKAHLLKHVHSLWDIRSHRMQGLAQDSGEYFSALRNLRSLTLYGIMVEHISKEDFRTCFSAFRGSLTYLSLDDFATSFSAFVTLVGYFPNITTLRLCSFDLEPDEERVPSLSKPLRGKLELNFGYGKANSLEFANRFAELNPEYQELVIESPDFTLRETELLGSVLRISASTIKILRLTAELKCE